MTQDEVAEILNTLMVAVSKLIDAKAGGIVKQELCVVRFIDDHNIYVRPYSDVSEPIYESPASVSQLDDGDVRVPNISGQPLAVGDGVEIAYTSSIDDAVILRKVVYTPVDPGGGGGGGGGEPYDSNPQMDGTASPGISSKYARGDHVHPKDASKQDTLTFDDVPTANSNNPVKSGGIKTAIDNSVLGNRGIFYGTCDTVDATTEKAVTCSDFTANDLVAGSVVMVLFSVTNSGAVASLTLNVNSTGAKSIKYISNGSYANIPAVGYLKANQIYQFTFDGTYWVVEMNYDTNNNAYRMYMADAKLKPFTNLYRYMICFTKDEQTILPVNAVSNTVSTGKQLTTEAFDPFGPIWYYNTTTTVNAGSNAGSLYYYANTIDLRYSFNTAKTLTASKNVYIVCDPQSNGKVKLASNPISQSLPTTEDGKVYILLGTAYDTYRVSLHPIHPIYYFKNGQIGIWTNPRESKVHFVHATDCNWALDGLSAQAYSDTRREQILSWLANNETVILSITDPNSYPYWLYAITDDSLDVFFESPLEYYASTGYCCYHASISDGPYESQCSIVKRIIRCVPSGGSTNQVLTKDANGYSWQGIPKQVHLVGMDSILWDADVTTATGEVSETRAQILSWLHSGDLVFLNIGDYSDPIWLFPHSDDTSDIYFSSVMYGGEYYKASFSDGYTTTQITVNIVKIAQVPSGGSVGQVLTKTANGYAWQNLPVYNGGFT